jgi:6-phosphogluconate dehydrogenase
MRDVLEMSNTQMSAVFSEWNAGDLDSFLIEITADILKQKDPVTGKDFVDVVLDAAGQKGTGKWTINSALDLGVPAPTMASGNARAMADMQASAMGVRKVISSTRTPPSSSALASGTASSSRWMTMTGITGPCVASSRGFIGMGVLCWWAVVARPG